MLLISAGSGITPMMSMTRWVQDTLAECDIVFLHCARTSDDIIFRTELEALSAQMPNFHLAVTLTQQPLGRSWMGLTGHISQSMLQLVAPDLLERAVYVCGPNGFMQSVRSVLEGLQFPMQNYKEESFGGRKLSSAKQTAPTTQPQSAKPQPALTATRNGHGKGHQLETLLENLPPPTKPDATKAAPTVQFTKSGQTVPADDSASILEIAEQEGVSIRYGCRVGSCGACKVRVSKGQVRYDTPPIALTSTEQQSGYALACVAYAVNQVAIEA
jgi:ferredoxin-NADP reductase